MGYGGENGELATDLVEARRAEGRDVKETPAVESQEVEFGREALRILIRDDGRGRRRDIFGGVARDDHDDSGM
jgi:hypothetical protein